MRKITLLFLLLGCTSFLSAQCLTATNGQYPATTYSAQVCDGTTINTITTLGYASEYSVVTVVAGETYTFYSSIATDVVTISSDGGTTADTFGIGTVTWVSTVSGDVRFYTNLDDGACGASTAFRARRMVCGTPPTCLPPTALTTSAVTTDAATVSWTASTTDPANGYEYYLDTVNTAPTAATPASGTVAPGTTSIDFNGLADSTTYYIWVRSVCSGSDTSAWSAMATFSTLCLAVTDFTENFDAAVAFPNCWAKIGTGGSSYVQASATTTSTPNNLYIYSGSAASQAVVAMRPVSNAGDGTHRLRFKARGNFTAGDAVQVGYLTDPADATTFVSLQSFTTTSITVYDVFTATLGTAPGANQVLAFRHAGNLGYSILIDDVVWEAIPSCVEPTALTASNIDASNATVSWTASASAPALGYNYYVSTTNTLPSTITGTTAPGEVSVTLANLAPSTVYYVWVQSNCAANDVSALSTVLTFTTACGPSTVPYSQDFESAVAPALPLCTSRENVGTGNNWTVVNNPGSGFTNKTLRYAYNSTNAANAWFYTNGVSLVAGTAYTVGYKYGNNSTTYNENLKVAVGTSAAAASMTTVLADHPGIIGGVAATNTVTFTPTVDGVYYFGFNAYSIADQYYLFVDNISVQTALATTGFDNNSFSLYPNPVKDILNIGYSKAIKSVAVYNMLGQEVAAKATDITMTQINMSNLSKGTYLVKVVAEDSATKTIKIVKE